jgi:hypothetical protein
LSALRDAEHLPLAPWIFRNDGRDVEWMPRSCIETPGDVLGVVSLAEQGISIFQSYELS